MKNWLLPLAQRFGMVAFSTKGAIPALWFLRYLPLVFNQARGNLAQFCTGPAAFTLNLGKTVAELAASSPCVFFALAGWNASHPLCPSLRSSNDVAGFGTVLGN